MGAGFVRRRMQAELGAGWRERFAEFDLKPAAAASLGQVHKARKALEAKGRLQAAISRNGSAVETDLSQLDLMFSLHRRMGAAIDTREIAQEIRERVREELDYKREAKIAKLYGLMLADKPFVRVPRVTKLVDQAAPTMQWLDGEKLTDFESAPQEARGRHRGRAVSRMVAAVPAYGVIHGDPHLGNYAVAASGRGRDVEGVDSSTTAACAFSRPASCSAWSSFIARSWAKTKPISPRPMRCGAFPKLTRGTFEAMTLWARFICGPILDDRVRTAADGVSPAEYGRKEIGQVMRASRPRAADSSCRANSSSSNGPPSASAAPSCGSGARLNFHRLYEDAIAGFSTRPRSPSVRRRG